MPEKLYQAIDTPPASHMGRRNKSDDDSDWVCQHNKALS
jgi:hypothetical protein